jgi:hypothetical protein
VTPDGDPDRGAVEQHAAFYGLWPKFADPATVLTVSAPPRLEAAMRGAGAWWATCQAPSLRSA